MKTFGTSLLCLLFLQPFTLAQPVFVPRQLEKCKNYAEFFDVPKEYLDDDLNRIYKGLDWAVDTYNKGDMRAFLHYPVVEFFGDSQEGFTHASLSMGLGPAADVRDMKQWKCTNGGITVTLVEFCEETNSYPTRQCVWLGFSKVNKADMITLVKEISYDDFDWEIENINRITDYAHRSYSRRDLRGPIAEVWVEGEKEILDPMPLHPRAVERMKIAVTRPDFRKPVVPKYEKGPFFARVKKPVRIQIPTRGRYEEVVSLLVRIQKYAEKVRSGQFGYLIENPIFKPELYPLYVVDVGFGKDYVNYAGVQQSGIKLYGELFFDGEESVTKYREGNFDVNKYIEDNAWHEIIFHTNGYPASYRSVVRNRLFGRQLEWNEKGELLSDVDLDIPQPWPDAPKTEEDNK